jgi:hypothetical protein
MTINRALIPLRGVIAACHEQPTHKLGTLSQTAFFGRSFGFVREFGFDLFKHPRQRNSERDHGLVQIRGDQFWSL